MSGRSRRLFRRKSQKTIWGHSIARAKVSDALLSAVKDRGQARSYHSIRAETRHNAWSIKGGDDETDRNGNGNSSATLGTLAPVYGQTYACGSNRGILGLAVRTTLDRHTSERCAKISILQY